MTLVRIEDDHQVYEFDAEVIAGPLSTRLDRRKRQRARWADFTLYRKADGSGYVFYQVSYSSVWHLQDGFAHVQKPLAMARGDLSATAMYCGILPPRPGRDHCPLAGRGHEPEAVTVLAEQPQYKVWTFPPDRDTVIRRLTMARHGDDSASAATSGPMRELLAQAAENDPAFRITGTAGKPVIRL